MSDVFISYAHEDAAFVGRLRTALAAHGREVWVDTAGIEPADRWRVSVHEAIERSDALLFVISSHSLRSDPCLGELEYAASLKKRVIPVCVDEASAEMDKPAVLEELSWIMMRPQDDFDPGVAAIIRALDTDLEVVRAHTRILARAKAWELAGRRASPLLRGEELRLAEEWLARAAASGTPPTELQQDFIAASRRAATTRLRLIAAVSGLVAVIAVALSIFALIQRSNAIHQATLATSRQLAALSENSLATNLDVALLLAVEGFRTDPNPQTRAALLQADLYSPRLARFLPMGRFVSALAGSNDRTTVVAGLDDGWVMRWDLRRHAPERIATLAASVTSVAVSGDGGVIAAVDGTRGVLWRIGLGSVPTSCVGGQRPDVATVSPSGQTVVVHCRVPAFEGPQSIVVIDARTGNVAAVHSLARVGIRPSILVAPSDTELFMLDGTYGGWERRRLPDWSLELASSALFGVHQSLPGYSADGRFFTVSNGATTIPVWRTSEPTRPFNEPLDAQAPIGNPTALAVSPGGDKVAVADSGTVYVAPVLRPHASYAPPAELTGNGSVNFEALQFFGDGAHVLSASGATVAVWDLTQFDRLARWELSSLQSPCNACPGAQAVVSPDGLRIAAVADNGSYALVQALGGRGRPQIVGPGSFGPPVWDGATVLLPMTGSSGPASLPPEVHVWPAAGPADSIVASALSGGHSVTIVDQLGNVSVEDPRSGKVKRRISGPRDLGRDSVLPLSPGNAAIDPSAGRLAIVDNGSVLLTNLMSGRVITRLRGTDAAYVAFAGPHLLVQRQDGSLELWDAHASRRIRVLPGDQSYRASYPVADSSGHLVARQRTDGTITIADLESGTTLGIISAPAPPSLELRLGLAFSPGGENLVTVAQAVGSLASEIIQRSVADQALVSAGCAAAGRRLTAGEWRTFVGSTPPSDLVCGR